MNIQNKNISPNTEYSEGYLKDLIQESLIKKFSYLIQKAKSPYIQNFDDTMIVDSGISSDTFNVIYTDVLEDKILQKAVTHFKKKKYPFSLWIKKNELNDKDKTLLDKYNFVFEESEVGMFCELGQSEIKLKCPENFDVIQISDPTQFKDYGDVFASIFEPIDSKIKLFYNEISENIYDDPNIKFLIGYYDQKPVCTSCILFSDNTIGIYDVITKNEYRKKGLGSYMFFKSLELAKNSYKKICVLQASQNGINIYKRLGFKDIMKFQIVNWA